LDSLRCGQREDILKNLIKGRWHGVNLSVERTVSK
jgi:hypothetical protein